MKSIGRFKSAEVSRCSVVEKVSVAKRASERERSIRREIRAGMKFIRSAAAIENNRYYRNSYLPLPRHKGGLPRTIDIKAGAGNADIRNRPGVKLLRASVYLLYGAG